MAVATYSVVRYELWIVLAYTGLAVLLALGLALRASGRIGRPQAAAALGLTAVLTLWVHSYTYLTADEASHVRLGLAVTAGLAAVTFLLPGRRAPDIALGLAIAGYLAVAVALIRLDPAPRIDVWVTLQQAADGLRHGKDMYTQVWVGSPGVQDAFTYLPWTAVLLAPGRWLAGDVRWMLVAITVGTVLAIRCWAPARGSVPGREQAAAVGAGCSCCCPVPPPRSSRPGPNRCCWPAWPAGPWRCTGAGSGRPSSCSPSAWPASSTWPCCCRCWRSGPGSGCGGPQPRPVWRGCSCCRGSWPPRRTSGTTRCRCWSPSSRCGSPTPCSSRRCTSSARRRRSGSPAPSCSPPWSPSAWSCAGATPASARCCVGSRCCCWSPT